MSRIPDSAFNEESEEIAQDVENTLDRVVNDYNKHWQGVIGEWIQNAYDGWCHNRFGRRTIPETQPLHIRFTADMNKRRFGAADNAGGMPEDTFYHNFAGLDTPGEEKQSGDFGGSYGRGSHVISGLGQEMYAETYHNRFRGGLSVRSARQMRTDAKRGISDEGTIVEVYDCDVETLVKLSEWERVRDYIQARFQPLLEHDDVTIEYEIDGMVHTIEPLDLSVFDTLWEGDLTFEHGNTEYTLRDVVIYDATSGPQDTPLRGVSMLKANNHMDDPFMRVQDYRPRQLRHLDKMFGFCDASDLCPEYEDNAHNSFTGNIVSQTGLKEKLEELERQHFIGTPTDLDEKDEIVNTTLEVVNDQWDHNPFGDGDADVDSDLLNDEDEDTDSEEDNTGSTVDVETETQPDEDSDPDEPESDDLDDPDAGDDDDNDDDTDIGDIDVDWGGDEDEDDDTDADDEDEDDDENLDDEDEDEDEADPEPELSCSTRKRSFSADEDVEVWVFVENPVEYDNERFYISAQLEHDESGDLIELDQKHLTIPPGEGSTGEHSWNYDTETTGKYLFRAYLHDRDSDTTDAIDSTNTWFWVGRDTTDQEADVNTVAFLEDVFLVRKDDEDFRAELTDGDRGMILMANTRHPEYKHAVKLDGRTGTKNQKLTLIRWAHESIMNRLLMDQLDDELADVYTEDGSPMAELLGGFVRENMIEQMSTLMAGAHEEV